MINIDKNNRIMESISYTSFNKISPTDRLKNTTIIKYVAIAFLILTSSYLWSYFWHTSTCNHNNNNVVFNLTGDGVMYDSKYPLSDPIIMKSLKFYKIGIIADLDQERSKTRDDTYKRKSYMKIGSLKVDDIGKIYSVEFPDEKYELTTYLTEKGRGLELSELCVYNKHLLTVDDRTGVVYQLINFLPVPWVILQDGNGLHTKGFKSEWMAVKNGFLYVGSTGKEFTTRTGDFLNNNPLFVKRVSPSGHVTHLNWTDNYRRIRQKLGVLDPGYIIHEAVVWSSIKQRWFFLPRRLSTLRYDDEQDENRATNVLISCTVNFTDFRVIYIGDLDMTHGFSSFKFVPGTSDDVAIALKTKEVGNDVSSYVTVFHARTGKTIMVEKGIASNKYEGIEFL